MLYENKQCNNTMVIIIVTHYVLGKFPMNHNAILQELLLTNSPEERKSQLHCLGWREDDDLKRGANQNSHDPDGSCRCFKCFCTIS